MIIGLCDRFHCLPSELGSESTRILYYLNLLSIAAPKDKASG